MGTSIVRSKTSANPFLAKARAAAGGHRPSHSFQNWREAETRVLAVGGPRSPPLYVLSSTIYYKYK